VKVGPRAMSYKGQAKFTELNEATHQVRMVGEAREVGGSGLPRSRCQARCASAGRWFGGRCQAEIDLVGKIVQFGCATIEEVSRQMFRQFSTCVRHMEVALETNPQTHPGPDLTQPGKGSLERGPNGVPRAVGRSGAFSSSACSGKPRKWSHSRVLSPGSSRAVHAHLNSP
jgi:hypothetical protein